MFGFLYRVYIPCIYILNKIDQISIEELDLVYKIPHAVPLSAHHKWNFDDLLEKIWEYLSLIRMWVRTLNNLEGKSDGFTEFLFWKLVWFSLYTVYTTSLWFEVNGTQFTTQS